MNQLRTFVSALLDKVDLLLKTEPARLIGYGAAAVIYLACRVLADRGYLDVRLDFEQSLGAAFGAIGSLIIIVESIRRFVFSPQTYIEDLSDEADAAHEAAHLEESIRQMLAQRAALQAESRAMAAEAKAAEAEATVLPIGTVTSSGSEKKPN